MKIILGDNSSYLVKGFGFVSFHLDYGEIIHIHDVMYILGLKKNLVSISALVDKGMRVAFHKRKGPHLAYGILHEVCIYFGIKN